MLDLGLALVLLLVVIGLLMEVNGIYKAINKTKRGRGRPRKNVDLQLAEPGGILK